MTNIKSWKALSISMTLISLMLISALVGTVTRPVKATPAYFTLHAVINVGNPYWGWRGGYHDVYEALKLELAKIGIDLEIHYLDEATVDAVVWYSDEGIVPGSPNDSPPGWDLTSGECWMYPHGLLWCGVRWGWGVDALAGAPTWGENLMSWTNPKAVKLFADQDAEYDPDERQQLLWKWQEKLMEDVPAVNLFYADMYDAISKAFSGLHEAIWYWDITHWELDNTTARDPGNIRTISESEIWQTSPMFLVNYAQEMLCDLQFEMLYMPSRDPWPPEEAHRNGSAYTIEGMTETWPYVVKPRLASGPPDYSDPMAPIVPLRDDVYWVWDNETVGPKFTPEDVVWTFTAALNPDTAAVAWDFVPVIDHVTKYNSTAVQFHLKAPHADFELLLSNSWGGMIMPKFVMKPIVDEVGLAGLLGHATNTDPHTLPKTGPFLVESFDGTAGFTMKRNPHYWCTDFDPKHTIQKVTSTVVIDPAAQLLMTKAMEVEWGSPGFTAADRADILATGYYDLVPTESSTFATHPIYFNLKNEHLANNYVRKAIAHAIPYPTIYDKIVPGWGGTVKPYFGTGAIYPGQTYKDVSLFNPNLVPYEYDLDKAQQYMDLYLNQTSATPELGPVGDADQSGLVNFDDWWMWRVNTGTNVATPIDVYPTWPHTIDPDFNNDGDIDDSDVAQWALSYGNEYP